MGGGGADDKGLGAATMCVGADTGIATLGTTAGALTSGVGAGGSTGVTVVVTAVAAGAPWPLGV